MKKTIKIVALMLALICIGTCLASCGSDSSIGGGLIPEKDKSETIGVGARLYVYGKSNGSGISDFTIDKTTNSTEELLAAFEKVSAPNETSQSIFIIQDASIEEKNCLKINLGRINEYGRFDLQISITLPEKIKKVTLTARKKFGFQYSEKVYTDFGTLSEDKKTFSFVGEYEDSVLERATDKAYNGTLRIYY